MASETASPPSGNPTAGERQPTALERRHRASRRLFLHQVGDETERVVGKRVDGVVVFVKLAGNVFDRESALSLREP